MMLAIPMEMLVDRRLTRSIATLSLALCATLFLLPAAPAGAWGNGGATPDAPEERNGYGTHDWIVDRALQTAGSAGSWLDAQVARLVTDDPDRLGRVLDSDLDAEHLYRETGTGRGAVHVISEHYNEAIAALKASDETAASQAFGLLAHHYGDIMQPYHAAYAGLNQDELHRDYEIQVDQRIRDSNDQGSWYARRDPATVTNIRKHASAAAAYSRSKFPALHDAFRTSRDIDNSTVNSITRMVLSRAANDLGDVIKSIGLQTGRAPGVASLSSSVKIRYIGQNQIQGVYVKAKGTDGNPIEGLKVTIDWPKASGGTTPEIVYTMPDGTAKLARNVGTSPLMVRRGVRSTATTSSLTETSSTWWMATPKLASGTTGFWAKSSNYHPTSTVKIRARAVNTSGDPVAGLVVDFTWYFKGRTIKTYATTNSNGNAYSSRDVSRSTTGYTVYVHTHVQSGGLNRYYKTKFTPA